MYKYKEECMKTKLTRNVTMGLFYFMKKLLKWRQSETHVLPSYCAYFRDLRLPGNRAGHSLDWRWPEATRGHLIGYMARMWASEVTASQRSSSLVLTWTWLLQSSYNHTHTRTLFLQHSGQTIRSACCGQVLSWRCRILSRVTPAGIKRHSQPTYLCLRLRCIHWHGL